MTTSTIKGLSVVKTPETSSKPYYATEDEWREFSGYTDQEDFPSDDVKIHLKNATEKVKKDGFHFIRWEHAVKDSEGRYFVRRRYFANAYGTAESGNTQIIHGEITKYDIKVWEVEYVGSVSASLLVHGSHINHVWHPIPYEGITEIDPLNGFFKLSDDYPTDSSRQIYVSYYVVGKPLQDIGYELKMACMEWAIVLALRKLKDKRLKHGTTQSSIGGRTISRDEETFDKLIQQHIDRYDSWIRWFKPFIGRRAKIGRAETARNEELHRRY